MMPLDSKAGIIAKLSPTNCIQRRFNGTSVDGMGFSRIARLSDFMKIMSTHYYSRECVLGGRGDFITSPLISQVFGEIVAVWLMSSCRFEDKNVRIIELGPGDGTLASDILRTMRSLSFPPEGRVEYIFVENSKSMIKLQMAAMNRLAYKYGMWYDCISSIPFDTFDNSPIFFIAHEFYDALPVRKFARGRDRQWEEMHIKFSDANGAIAPVYLKCHASLSNFLDRRYQHLDMVELSPASWSYARFIGDKIRRHGGGLFFCDYGGFGPIENSLRVHSSLDLTHRR